MIEKDHLRDYLDAFAARVPPAEGQDVIFFGVAPLEGASAEGLLAAIKSHDPAFGEEVDLLDGGEHNYLELGGWVGDQGAALTMMGLSAHLGMWQLLTPRTLGLDDEKLIRDMAGMGFVSIQKASVPAVAS